MKLFQSCSPDFEYVVSNYSTLLSEEMGEYIFKYVNCLHKTESRDMLKHIRENFILMNGLKYRYITKTNEKYREFPDRNIIKCVSNVFGNLDIQENYYKFGSKVKRNDKKSCLENINLIIEVDKERVNDMLKKKLDYYKKEDIDEMLKKFMDKY